MDKPHLEQISLADFLIWEEQQPERHEWIDGVVVRCRGGSDDHAIIISNLNAAFHAAVRTGPCVVRGSDRQLVPRDYENNDLGSFYADLFVSCSAEDRAGSAAHFPTVVVEVLSKRLGEELRDKKQAYLNSAQLVDYVLIDSRKRSTTRFSWTIDTETKQRRLFTCEQLRGPLVVPSLDLVIPFDEIYAKTNVALALVHPVKNDLEEETEVLFD
jgi:Uma2 family endonuclease